MAQLSKENGCVYVTKRASDKGLPGPVDADFATLEDDDFGRFLPFLKELYKRY